MEEPPLLGAVKRIVGRVQIQHDLLRGRLMRLQEQLHQKPVDRPGVGNNPLVAIGARRLRAPQLQPIERARPRQRMAPVAFADTAGPDHIRAPARQRQRRVRAHTVMVVQILVAQRQSHHPLRHHHLKIMLRATRIAVVVETPRQTTADVEQPIRFPKQQRTPVRGHPSPVKTTRYLAPSKTFK